MSWLKKDKKGLIQKKLSFLDYNPKEKDLDLQSGSTTEEEEDYSSGETIGSEDSRGDSEELPEYSDIEDGELVDFIERFDRIETQNKDLFETITKIRDSTTIIQDCLGLVRDSITKLIERIENGTKRKIQKKVQTLQ